jgi:hypothetical protein
MLNPSSKLAKAELSLRHFNASDAGGPKLSRAKRPAGPSADLGGGHNESGLARVDDGLVIDLSTMKGVRVDPAAGTARVANPVHLLDHRLLFPGVHAGCDRRTWPWERRP